jgi:sugar O-acyltransferase (sialic acid O-acetyltransferase NeuD family)
MKPLILIGGGGHCKSVIDVVESAGYEIIGILDLPHLLGKQVLQYKIIGTNDDIIKYVDQAQFVVSVGQIKTPDIRMKLSKLVEEKGGELATIISPTAHVSRYASLGRGTVIMHQVLVNAGAKIGNGCIINTKANIEHEVIIGDYCHISTGAMINGGASIADGTFIGSQSVVNQCINVTTHVVVASLSVVNKDIMEEGIYAGCPACRIK